MLVLAPLFFACSEDEDNTVYYWEVRTVLYEYRKDGVVDEHYPNSEERVIVTKRTKKDQAKALVILESQYDDAEDDCTYYKCEYEGIDNGKPTGIIFGHTTTVTRLN